jgi:hypothetical protein
MEYPAPREPWTCRTFRLVPSRSQCRPHGDSGAPAPIPGGNTPSLSELARSRPPPAPDLHGANRTPLALLYAQSTSMTAPTAPGVKCGRQTARSAHQKPAGGSQAEH